MPFISVLPLAVINRSSFSGSMPIAISAISTCAVLSTFVVPHESKSPALFCIALSALSPRSIASPTFFSVPFTVTFMLLYRASACIAIAVISGSALSVDGVKLPEPSPSSTSKPVSSTQPPPGSSCDIIRVTSISRVACTAVP